jgi:hypothetical protein
MTSFRPLAVMDSEKTCTANDFVGDGSHCTMRGPSRFMGTTNETARLAHFRAMHPLLGERPVWSPFVLPAAPCTPLSVAAAFYRCNCAMRRLTTTTAASPKAIPPIM